MKKSARGKMDIREAMKLAGSKGGKSRARNLTREKLSEIGRKGVEASRGKPRKPYKKREKKGK